MLCCKATTTTTTTATTTTTTTTTTHVCGRKDPHTPNTGHFLNKKDDVTDRLPVLDVHVTLM